MAGDDGVGRDRFGVAPGPRGLGRARHRRSTTSTASRVAYPGRRRRRRAARRHGRPRARAGHRRPRRRSRASCRPSCARWRRPSRRPSAAAGSGRRRLVVHADERLPRRARRRPTPRSARSPPTRTASRPRRPSRRRRRSRAALDLAAAFERPRRPLRRPAGRDPVAQEPGRHGQRQELKREAEDTSSTRCPTSSRRSARSSRPAPTTSTSRPRSRGEDGQKLQDAIDAFVSKDRTATRFYVTTSNDPYCGGAFAIVRTPRTSLADGRRRVRARRVRPPRRPHRPVRRRRGHAVARTSNASA